MSWLMSGVRFVCWAAVGVAARPATTATRVRANARVNVIKRVMTISLSCLDRTVGPCRRILRTRYTRLTIDVDALPLPHLLAAQAAHFTRVAIAPVSYRLMRNRPSSGDQV